MSEVVLDGAGVMAVVGELETAPVPEHVRMNRKSQRRFLPGARQHLAEPGRRHRPAPLGQKHIGAAGRPFPFQPPQRPQLGTAQGMDAGRAPLDPVDLEQPLFQVDLVPAQRHQLRHAQAVAVGQQDHGRVAVAVPSPRLGRPHQLLHFACSEVLATAAFAVRDSSRWNCPILGIWCGHGRWREKAGDRVGV